MSFAAVSHTKNTHKEAIREEAAGTGGRGAAATGGVGGAGGYVERDAEETDEAVDVLRREAERVEDGCSLSRHGLCKHLSLAP